jgi:hypothetical protein
MLQNVNTNLPYACIFPLKFPKIKRMTRYNLIIPVGIKPKPAQYEQAIAEILSKYFKSDIRFIKRASSITSDIHILKLKQDWEIKNIRGNSKHTIEHNLKKAGKQSRNIIISLLRTKITSQRAKGYIKIELQKANKIQRLLLITKEHQVLAIK